MCQAYDGEWRFVRALEENVMAEYSDDRPYARIDDLEAELAEHKIVYRLCDDRRRALKDERDIFKRTLDKRDAELAQADDATQIAEASNRELKDELAEARVKNKALESENLRLMANGLGQQEKIIDLQMTELKAANLEVEELKAALAQLDTREESGV